MDRVILAAYLRLLADRMGEANNKIITTLEESGIDINKAGLGRYLFWGQTILQEEAERLSNPIGEKLFKKIRDLDDKVSKLS